MQKIQKYKIQQQQKDKKTELRASSRDGGKKEIHQTHSHCTIQKYTNTKIQHTKHPDEKYKNRGSLEGWRQERRSIKRTQNGQHKIRKKKKYKIRK